MNIRSQQNPKKLSVSRRQAEICPSQVLGANTTFKIKVLGMHTYSLIQMCYLDVTLFGNKAGRSIVACAYSWSNDVHPVITSYIEPQMIKILFLSKKQFR